MHTPYSNNTGSNLYGAPRPDMPGPAATDNLLDAGINSYSGENGFPRDPEYALSCFATLHEQGDLNASYYLAFCYYYGIGVYRDLPYVQSLTTYMLQNGFPAAYLLQSLLHEIGVDAPFSVDAAQQCRDQVIATCSSPVPGMDERVRYNALFGAVTGQEDMEELSLAVVREYFSVSSHKDKYGNLASVLLASYMKDDGNENLKEEIGALLDEGCAKGDYASLLLKGALMSMGSDICPGNPKKARRLMAEAAAIGEPSCVGTYAKSLEDKMENAIWADRYLQSCQHGWSGIPHPDGLNVDIRLKTEFSACWEVFENSDLGDLEDEGRVELARRVCPANIVITNNGSAAMFGVVAHVACPASGVFKTVAVDRLGANESWTIRPWAEDLPLVNGDVIVTVICNGKRAMSYFSILGGFGALSPELPPLSLGWRKGLFGGYILCIYCDEGEVHDVMVHKLDIEVEAHSDKPESVYESSPLQIGWAEMDDGAGLKENEPFIVTMRGYAPIIAAIRPDFDVKTTPAWHAVAAELVKSRLCSDLVASAGPGDPLRHS